MAIRQRYYEAVHSDNLTVDPKTRQSDTDVLGAMGIAARVLEKGRNAQGDRFKPVPLAVPLERLFAGDNRAVHEIVRQLAQMVFERASVLKIKINRIQAHDIACACLAWYRDGRCRPCGGHGYKIIPGTVTLGIQECDHCHGRGRIPCEDALDPPARALGKRHPEFRVLGPWLMTEMERASGKAGPEAMRALAPKLDL